MPFYCSFLNFRTSNYISHLITVIFNDQLVDSFDERGREGIGEVKSSGDLALSLLSHLF